MADLGALSMHIASLSEPARHIPTWADATRFPIPVWTDTNSVLSGSVTAAGSPVPRAVVRLYYRSTGQLLASTYSESDGTFSFTGIYGGSPDFFAVAFDPDGGVAYNAVIFDRLTPVSGTFTVRAEAAGYAQYGTHSIANVVDALVYLRFEGADGSTTFTDDIGATWTPAGGAIISTAWSGSGSSSGYFPGNGRITTPDTGGNNFVGWATDDFRITFDMYATGAPGYGFIFTKRSSTGVYPPIEISFNGGYLTINMSSGSTQYYATMATPLSLSTKYTIRVERIGTSLKCYVDGVESITCTIPSSISYYTDSRDSPLSIGSIGDGAYPYYGYIDNFEIKLL